jgi:hypothetical protein
LASAPDILRKGAGGKLGISLPAPADAVAKYAIEEHCRIAEERRLAKRSGKRRYRAPEQYRGKRITLIDGRNLVVPEHGIVELADGRHPASPDATESPAHNQLLSLGFEALPDRDEDEMDVVKSALREPIIGDEAVSRFLRNARAGR